MLKINKIKIEVNTIEGIFLGEYTFDMGLNVIKGLNTSGKSTLFQAMLYALGIEELLGGKNAKMMQSALREKIEKEEEKFIEVTASKVFLELQNLEKSITIERTIRGEKSPKLVRIYYGNLLTKPDMLYESIDTWIHDPGGASNKNRGFHYLLEEFLGWKLPKVVYNNGSFRKLYLQSIFPGFIIEQKGGWSDLLSTIPHYGIKNVESKSIEFLLKLDVFENEQAKLKVKSDKLAIQNEWKTKYNNLQYLLNRGDLEISGINNFPETLINSEGVALYLFFNGRRRLLNEILYDWKEEFKELSSRKIATNLMINQQNLKYLNSNQSELEELIIRWEFLSQNIKIRKSKIEQYEIQLKDVQEELRKNKDVEKIYKLGGEANISLAKKKCPTCNQPIEDSLFPIDADLNPMSIGENIKYIKAQEKMILAFLQVERSELIKEERNASQLYKNLNDIRISIRSLKKSLIEDDRIPSEAQIEKKIRLETKISFYTKLVEETNDAVEEFLVLSDKYNEIIGRERKLPSNLMSRLDYDKFKTLEKRFKLLLTTFEYSSKGRDNIAISKDIEKRFGLPVVEDEGIKYSLRYDSSGSDLIRTIWAYSIALLETSLLYNTNHPGLLIFDEPAQQGVGHSGFNEMMIRLASNKKVQSFVISSFNESKSYYENSVKGIEGKFKLIDISFKSISIKS